MDNTRIIIVVGLVLFGFGLLGAYYFYTFEVTEPGDGITIEEPGDETDIKPENITSFDDCVAAGQPVMESYPRQCRIYGETYVEDIGNELELQDFIMVDSPRPNTVVGNPIIITGNARGYWFFEASFPVRLLDGNGEEIAVGIATAKDDWMTEEFVPFELELDYKHPGTEKGTLLLERDNPSDLPENDAALRIPIKFE